MPARRVNPHRVKLHRVYSVQELADCLGVHKNTVRHWQVAGLAAIDGNRPTLFDGKTTKAFLLARQTSRKRPCPPGMIYAANRVRPRWAWWSSSPAMAPPATWRRFARPAAP